MKSKRSLCLIILLLALLFPISSLGQNQAEPVLEIEHPDMTFKVYENSDGYRTELIMGNSSSPSILKGEIFFSTLDGFISTLEKHKEELQSDIMGINISVNYHEKVFSGTLDMVQDSDLKNAVMELLYRYSGRFWDVVLAGSQIWPVDMALAVLESFPEQYSVSVAFQRGNDLLTVVLVKPVSLFVWTKSDVSNISEEPDTKKAIYSFNSSVSIASGGSSTTITFPTFSVGKNYRAENLVFQVIVYTSPSVYLIYNQTTIDTGISRYSNPPNITQMIDSDYTGELYLPYPWSLIVSVLIIAIFRSFVRRNGL